jgi:hypothetical protein
MSTLEDFMSPDVNFDTDDSDGYFPSQTAPPFHILSFPVFQYSFFPFPSFFRGAGVVPAVCVLNLSTSTFPGWIYPLEFVIHFIHPSS